MVKLIERLTGNFLSFARHEDTMLALSRQYFTRAACVESGYARYNKPAYLRREKLVAGQRRGFVA